MFSDDLLAVSQSLIERGAAAGLMIVTAESCTGGLIAGCLTEIAGSSQVFERGFVTYSNEAKAELLGVPMALIQERGAVSAEVAESMADGALAASHADLAVAATGIAGPGGATPQKPVGLVYLGFCRRGANPSHERHFFQGDRDAVRLASVAAALDLLGRKIGTA